MIKILKGTIATVCSASRAFHRSVIEVQFLKGKKGASTDLLSSYVSAKLPPYRLRWRKYFKTQFMESSNNPKDRSPGFSTYAPSNRSGGRASGLEMKDNYQRSRGRGSGPSGKDKIDSLGRLLTRILRHMASELKLDMRADGYVKVQDLLKLDMKTFANVPLRSHTIYDIREAVRKDNKQRFSLVEENGELLIRANQGHTVAVTFQLFYT